MPSIDNNDFKKENAEIARWLFIGAMTCSAFSSPMFFDHFNEVLAKPGSPFGEHGLLILFVVENIKIALFSSLAVWAGKHFAAAAGIDAPVIRALTRGQKKVALQTIKKTLSIGLFLGLAGIAVKIGIGFVFEGKNFIQVVNPLGRGRNPFFSATSAFYAFDVSLWFFWGILPLASRALSSALGLSAIAAFPWSNALAALAFGLFACISVYGPHRGEVGASKYLAEAILAWGLPNFIFGLAIRNAGLISAAIASIVGALASLVVTIIF